MISPLKYALTMKLQKCGIQKNGTWGVKVYNPAFDVSDNSLVTAIITEFGIARAPYDKSLKDIFAKKEAASKK